MALSANKRQKFDHVSWQDREDDETSFASFHSVDDLHEEIHAANDVVEHFDAGDEALEGFENSGSDKDHQNEDEEGENGRVHRMSAPRVKKNNQFSQTSHENPRRTKRSSLDPAGGVYSASTFKSHMFKLQVDEMLEQIRPRHGKREGNADQALHTLKRTIERIPPRQALSVDEAEKELLVSIKVAVPFPSPRPPKDAKYKLEYAKPGNINVVGSYVLKTASRKRDPLEIDMALTIPANLFQEKDFLNFRYFYKRAYYLACVAAGLKTAHLKDFSLQYENFHGDPLKPILVVTPIRPSSDKSPGNAVPNWRINILPCTEPDTFESDKLRTDKNCVRPNQQINSFAKEMESTPFYNSSLRADMLVTSYLRLINRTSTTCSAFRDACILGSTWLQQRGFGSNVVKGGLGCFEWSALMAVLLQGGGPSGKPVLNEGWSSYQLFKATLRLLAIKDLSKQALEVGPDSVNLRPAFDGSPVVWDETRGHNLLYKVTPWAYALLRQESKTTLTMLGDSAFDRFEATFILRTDTSLLRHDHVVEISALAASNLDKADHRTLAERYQKLYNVVKRGLNDRVSQIQLYPLRSGSWSLGTSRPEHQPKGTMVVGIVVNPDTVDRTVDHGPLAENKSEAESFQKFWGDKAELRRFKDGRILESLIWTSNECGQSVLEQILRLVLQRNFGKEVEQSARFSVPVISQLIKHSSNITAFQPIMDAYRLLETDIRRLEDLPLSVRQIAPADAQLRYASVTVPNLGKQLPEPANVTIQFEGSARWPDDLVAIQRTKIAFLLKLHDLLLDDSTRLESRVGLENRQHDIMNQAFLDIIYDSGAAFRLRIHHDREQTLLERRLKDKSLGPEAKETAALALANYKRNYVKTPAHTQAIIRLCSRYAALSGTIRLTKKWFAAHLLSNHFADETIELIVARTFIEPWPWQTPSSVQTAFLRTLHWLSRWDWKANPLIVDLSDSGELEKADIQAVQTMFDAWRKLDPSLNRIVLFAGSNIDRDGTSYTDGLPTKVVAGRMTSLARAACTEVEHKALKLDLASLFCSSLSDFDFVLHLNPRMANHANQTRSNVGTGFKNLELEALAESTLVGFDPVDDFLRELGDTYGSAIVFFSGGKEKPIIAGLWSPQTARRAWKVNLAFSTVPLKIHGMEGVHAEINKQAILCEITKLAGDMIERVEVN